MDSSVLARKAASGRQQEVLSPPWKSNEFHSLVQKACLAWRDSDSSKFGLKLPACYFHRVPFSLEKIPFHFVNYHFDLFFSITKKQFWKETERSLIVFLPWKNHQSLCGEQR